MSDDNLPAPITAPPLHPVEVPAQRWRLIRDLLVFQFKLVFDGLKDLVLGPLSLVAGVIDLARATPEQHGLFRQVLRAGASFDRWVGLFALVEQPSANQQLPAAEPRVGPRVEAHVEAARAPSLDGHLQRLELLLIAQQQHGALTADAKRAVDHALDLLEAGVRSATASAQQRGDD